MSTHPDKSSKLEFTSKCVPGSAAELAEAERIAEFQRLKAIRKAEEEQGKGQAAAQREEQHQADKERMHKKRMTTYQVPR